MFRRRLAQLFSFAALLFTLPLVSAQDVEEPVAVASAVVPVVGTVRGAADTVWRTELTIQNTTGAEAFVAVRLLSDPEESFLSTLVAPGDIVGFSDISQEAFGKSGILSPLLIQTVGNRSVTVSAVVYGIQEDRVSPPQPIPVIYGEPRGGTMHLGPLSFDQQFRTNLGLVNLGDNPVLFTISVQRIPGRNLAVDRVAVAPRSLIHSPLQVFFPLLNEGTGLTVVVDPGSAKTYAYASMIRNAGNQARFFAPR